jgi:hypothetical protein
MESVCASTCTTEILGRVTELVLVLCGAVIKTAFTLWSGGNAFVATASGDLTDLLKGQVSGALEQRKVRRQFEKMEEIVADQVIGVLGAEFRHLAEGEKNAAILAVTETFNRARLTDKALFTANLDPLYLTNHVRRFTGGATRDLSMDGTALYDRVLAQCCAYIIEIADKLPRFQAGAFAELLRREDQIIARLTEVLERLPVPAQGGVGTADRVETAYRQLLVKRFDRLELFGLDFAAQWYALSIAYVNLTVTAAAVLPGAVGTPRDGQPIGTVEQSGHGAAVFGEWLARYPRLLLEGRAGGGKTTILQWIAVRAALRDFTEAAAVFNGYIPFFLRLREYADGRLPLPQPEEFLDKVASLLAPEAGSWPREQLKAGRALVLVDGVDEVPEARRAAVLDWLRELTGLFPNVRYIVTTRPKALEDGALRDAGFVQVNLEPMDPPLIRVFIEQWHAAMREFQKDADSLARLDQCRNRLVSTLDDDRFLSELANTPLLAGLICALNHHLNAQLPRRRSEIFEKALSMFHERDRKRGVPEGLSLDLDATNHLLGDLALWMVRNSQIEVAAEDAAGTVAADSARGRLRQSAMSLPTRPSSDAPLYEHLLLRSGVLREPTEGRVNFVHRTFQEYLAAKALIRTDNIGEIVTHAGDDQWREIVILASGQGNVKQATDLLHGLMRAGWRGKDRYLRRVLAVACLDEIRAADPKILADIDKAIPALLPPRDMDQAERLSHAGERLIPHLAKYLPDATGTTGQPIIRAASLIGGPEAFRLVRDMAKRIGIPSSAVGGSPAMVEFMRAWRYFEPGQFTEEVIMPMSPEDMRVTDELLLREVSRVHSVRTLTLSLFLQDGTALESIRSPYVRELTLEDCDIKSLTGIPDSWPRISSLRLVRCRRLENLGALTRLPGLLSLEIVRCERIDYGVIGGLSELKRVDVSSVPKIDLRGAVGTSPKVYVKDVKEVLRPAPCARPIPVIIDEAETAAQIKAANAHHRIAQRNFS